MLGQNMAKRVEGRRRKKKKHCEFKRLHFYKEVFLPGGLRLLYPTRARVEQIIRSALQPKVLFDLSLSLSLSLSPRKIFSKNQHCVLCWSVTLNEKQVDKLGEGG